MTQISKWVHQSFPHPLDEEVWNVLLCEHDAINQQLLLDDLLLCKDCPSSVTNVDVWNKATQYIFDNSVDMRSVYIVDARALRSTYMREDRARIRVLLGRGTRGR